MKNNPFQEWLESPEGKLCADFSTLKQKEYLENRLYHAYSAGCIWEYNKHKNIQSTIDWYEQKLRELKAKVASLEAALQQGEQQPQP